MSLTQEDLQAISKLLLPMQQDIHEMKQDIAELKQDVAVLKQDVAVLKQDVATLNQKVDILDQRVTNIEVSLENETNKNIQLLAENHINLVDKLNQAIRVSDKTLLYEVQVSTLKSKVENLEREIAEIKKTIA